MKNPCKSGRRDAAPTTTLTRQRGMTLLEMTVVILVLLSLIGLLFASSRAWKAGADRSACLLNLQSVQKAMRGHANMHGYNIGSTITDFQSKLIGPGTYIEATPTCPSNGTYTFGEDYGVDTVPPLGTIYMKCSLAATRDHEPPNYSEW